MKRITALLMAALLVAGVGLPVWAEEPAEEPVWETEEAEREVGRLPIPDFDPAIWPAPRPIDSTEEAIAYAREIFASDLLNADLTDARWDAQWEDVAEVTPLYVQHRSACRVTCTLPGDGEMSVLMYANNGGIRALFGPPIPDFTEWTNGKADLADPWRESVWQYALALLEAMEPGVTDTFQSMRDGGDFLVDGIRFVQLEFIIDSDYSKCFQLQVFPVIRLLEAYTGLG